MKKIVLVDNLYSDLMMASHNKKYADSLLTIPGIFLHKDFFPFQYNSRSHYIQGYTERINYIRKIKAIDCIWHFLSLDYLYRYPIIFYNMKKKGIKTVGTLHNIPKTRNTKLLLYLSSKFIDKIVVHSDYLCSKLSQSGIKNVVSINYPAFVEENIVYSTLDISKDKYKILCLGGTRWNKGADLAIDAARYLNTEDKDKIIFIFAGIEEDIKYENILKIANQYNINVYIDNRILPEYDYWNYIYNSNSIFIPYRKGFSGASGPLTDGTFMGKVILGPSSGNLGYTITENHLGVTFESENAISMAKAIHNVVNGDFEFSERTIEYRKSLNEKFFLEKYSGLYRELSDGKRE